MELITLDQNFQPDQVVENYESLVWSERYSTNGDFELQSTDIGTTMDLLPKESCVSLRESTVPMRVEDYKIRKEPKKAPVIVVTGRAFETVLERRASVNSLPSSAARAAWMMNAVNESDAAYKAMRTVLGDVARSKSGTQVLAAMNPAVSALDAIPEIDLALPADFTPDPAAWNSTTAYTAGALVSYGGKFWRANVDNTNATPTESTGSSVWTSLTFEIKSGNLYTTVMELVNTNHHGLKAVRPAVGSTKIGIEVYNGADLTNEVVFDARFDQIDDATYLLSERGSTNVAYVYGPNGSQMVLKTSAPEPSGLNRRVLLVDDTNENSSTTEIRRSRGLIELYKYNATALFDGQVAQQVATGYNTTYNLGDIVKLVGEYGLSQDVRVAEFIRTSDATGEKAYPAFEAVS